jgi:hypothetical protein
MPGQALVLACLLAVFATVGGSQPTAQPKESVLRIAGHLVRQTVDGERPLASATVTLHRIGRQSGPVDSMQTSAQGAFAFEISADSSSMYVATARHHGIAYSSSPARLGEAGGEFEIVTFDTTSQPLRIAVAGRHVIVSLPNARGDRTVIDVLEVENDTVLTRVTADGRPVFAVQLPGGARNATTRQGDFIGSSVQFAGNEARVIAPMAPGVRQLVLQYVLPATAFPVSLNLAKAVTVLEVLLEEPDATAELAPGTLSGVESVTTDGRTFRRALSRTVPEGAVLQINVPDGAAAVSLGALGIALLSLAALAGLWWWQRTRRDRTATAEAVLHSISALDAVIADPETPAAARDRLRAERAAKYAAAERLLARDGTSD